MDSDPHNKATTHGHGHQQHSSSELLSSAKLVAQAAQSTVRHEPDKVDKAKVADAAGDLLEAACQYGKLEEKGFGKYVDKAEDYLRHYHSTNATAATHGGAAGHSEHPYSASSHSSKPQSHGDGHSGGGYGDYLKMAQGFMKSDSATDSHSSKPESHGDGGNSGGGYGDYLKMAEGFLKKH